MKIGIVGNGGIVQIALSSMRKNGIEVTALWCRNQTKGEPLQKEYSIPQLYTDYDAFLKDDSFDTVYIGLINSLHYEYAKKALCAGKHVIVEKPFTSTYNEAKDLINTALDNHVFLFEAILERYSKNYDALIKHFESLGDIKLIQSNYSQYSRRYDAYQKGEVLPAFDPKYSGGALYDINVYNIHFVTGLFGSPKFSYYMCNKGFNGIDTSGILIMDYGNFKAVCTGAKDSGSPCYTVIQGTDGYLYIPHRGGEVKDVTLHSNNDNTDTIIDVQAEEPMEQEFLRIQEVIDTKNETLMYKWMNQSLITMYVLENARLDTGIVFDADDEEE